MAVMEIFLAPARPASDNQCRAGKVGGTEGMQRENRGNIIEDEIDSNKAVFIFCY